MTAERHFSLRRLHSLSGIVPIGAFLAFHLYENYTATRGADAYNRMARTLQDLPFAVPMEIVIIIVPLVFHGIYGLFLSSTREPNVISNSCVRDVMYFIQRVTGVVVFAFILFHLWTTRLVQLRDHESLDLFRQVQAAIENPWIYAFYLAGILSATFHLANGLWSFSIVWGLTIGPKAQRRMLYVSAAVFVVLSYIGVRGIQAFRLQRADGGEGTDHHASSRSRSRPRSPRSTAPAPFMASRSCLKLESHIIRALP